MSEFDEQFAAEPEASEVVPQISEPEVVAPEPEPEPVFVPEPEVVYVPEPDPAPAPAAEEIVKSKNEEPAAPASAPFEKVVLMSSLEFQAVGKRSLSVAYVQERLVELGFYDAGADKRGWFSVGTKKSLSDFAGSDSFDMSVIERLFAGTNVKVIH